VNVKAVRDEIAAKLAAIDGLRVFPYDVDKVPPPGAVIGLPERIDFDQTYGRGSDKITLPLWVMVARSDSRSADAELSAYLDGSGTKSIKAAVDSSDSNTYEACDTVTVTVAEPDFYGSGGVPLLGAEFTVDIHGRGQVS
jgi:hypothetical protein